MCELAGSRVEMGGKERNKGELEGKRDKKKSLRNLENQNEKNQAKWNGYAYRKDLLNRTQKVGIIVI